MLLSACEAIRLQLLLPASSEECWAQAPAPALALLQHLQIASSRQRAISVLHVTNLLHTAHGETLCLTLTSSTVPRCS